MKKTCTVNAVVYEYYIDKVLWVLVPGHYNGFVNYIFFFANDSFSLFSFSIQIFLNLISVCYMFCSLVCLIVFIHPSILQTTYLCRVTEGPPSILGQWQVKHLGQMASPSQGSHRHIHTHNHTYRLVTRAGTTLSSLSTFSYFPSLMFSISLDWF